MFHKYCLIFFLLCTALCSSQCTHKESAPKFISPFVVCTAEGPVSTRVLPQDSGLEEGIFSTLSSFVEEALTPYDYDFSGHLKAPLVTIRLGYEVVPLEEDGSEVALVQEVYEGEGNPGAQANYQHTVHLQIQDKRCGKKSTTFSIALESKEEQFVMVEGQIQTMLEEALKRQV